MILPRPALATVVCTTVASVVLAGCDASRSADLDGPSSSVTRTTLDREEQAATVVADLERVLRRGEVRAQDTEGLSDEEATELRVLARNARRLELRDVSLRHLSASSTTLSDRQQERWGESAWVADAQLSWRYGDIDRQPSVLSIPVVFRTDDDDGSFVSTRLPQAERLPLWLAGPVQVARSERAMVVTTPKHSPARFLRFADTAAQTVDVTVPQWQGRLCLEVAADQAGFRDVAGIPQEQAAAVAAVTTTPDGVSTRGAAQHVYVNPKLFGSLSSQGRAIVLAHEAAHVALGAALLQLPLWLSEGIADYVALARSEEPVSRLAAQVLELTRKRGAPRSLPGDARFDGSDRHIGAWYEAAWLAAKLIADTYGEDALWRFYRQAVKDQGTARAFKDELGTTQADFVRDWRDYLSATAAG